MKREVQYVLFHLVRWYHALMQTPGRANSIHVVAWKQKREKGRGRNPIIIFKGMPSLA